MARHQIDLYQLGHYKRAIPLRWHAINFGHYQQQNVCEAVTQMTSAEVEQRVAFRMDYIVLGLLRLIQSDDKTSMHRRLSTKKRIKGRKQKKT